MNSAVLQLLVLAGIAVFLILRLKDVLGTRDGFEKTPTQAPSNTNNRNKFEVIEGGPDRDIIDHVPDGSDSAKALAEMKRIESDFGVSDFIGGARGAYEMILMAFENGEIDKIKPFLAEEVHETFSSVVEAREKEGLSIDATFIGVRESTLMGADFDKKTGKAEIRMKFVGELTSVVRDKKNKIIEGNATEVKRQKDIWTFGRTMGADDPNWQLVATGE